MVAVLGMGGDYGCGGGGRAGGEGMKIEEVKRCDWDVNRCGGRVMNGAEGRKGGGRRREGSARGRGESEGGRGVRGVGGVRGREERGGG